MNTRTDKFDYYLCSILPDESGRIHFEFVPSCQSSERQSVQKYLGRRYGPVFADHLPEIQQAAEQSRRLGWIICIGVRQESHDYSQAAAVVREAAIEMAKGSVSEVSEITADGFSLAAVAVNEGNRRLPKKKMQAFCILSFVDFNELAGYIHRSMAQTRNHHERLPNPQDTDPSRNRLPEHQERPNGKEWANKIENDFNSFVNRYPDEGPALVERLSAIAEAKRPPSKIPTLGLREAARRISRRTGIKISHVQLRRYYDNPEINIGSENENGDPIFSEFECDHFDPPQRGPGRPKKTA